MNKRTCVSLSKDEKYEKRVCDFIKIRVLVTSVTFELKKGDKSSQTPCLIKIKQFRNLHINRLLNSLLPLEKWSK